MPYDNLPRSQWGKMDRCVEKVMAEGNSKEKAIAICYTSIKAECGDEQHKASKDPQDYLIVENPEQVSTYHLQVRTDGKPDHQLMGAAWAALHGGYRGNKYEGPGKQEAIDKLRKLYEQEKMPVPSEKEGRRNSNADMERIQQAHDLLTDLGAKCAGGMGEDLYSSMMGALTGKDSEALSVFKDSTGILRWVAVTSTSFQDRDGEIVSTKALQADTARMNATGQYGPLRFWHTPGIDLGACDFSAMHDKASIESGTFASEEIGEAIKAHASELELSIAFYHPADEPDAEGVYHHIVRFERSLVPKGKASNLLTTFAVKEATMKQEKAEFLRKLLGPLADKVLGNAEQAQKQAEAAGVAHKAEDPAPDPTPETKAAEAVPPEQDEALKAINETLKAINDRLGKLEEAQVARVKEAGVNGQRLDEFEKALKSVAEVVADLNGSTPQAAKGYRASQADDTVTTKSAGPQPDGQLQEFFGWIAKGDKK